MSEESPPDVVQVGPFLDALRALFSDYGLRVKVCDDDTPIPGSYWGDDEAGLERDTLHVRRRTPLHSALHEACHFACMSDARRRELDTDAGGDDLEECAVCYLSVLLADRLPGFGRERMLEDMDAWGYSFRLGSARAWFEHDAEDARSWLENRGLVDADARVLSRADVEGTAP